MINLTGTKTERDIREQLLVSKDFIFNNPEGSRILNLLNELYPELSSAYVLKCIPEQAEDEYIIIVDGTQMIWIEISRVDSLKEPEFEKLNFREYERGSRQRLIKMAIAKELAEIDLAKHNKALKRDADNSSAS